MDVVAGRKTMGRIEGEILVNGFPKESASFEKLAGYVEQNDIHIGTATVREALLFSAKMRLPVSVEDSARETFVDEVMSLVGLTSISGRVIGDSAIPGLSPGQLKLVTIGVELVANPSVIFLDEPTSGLDAPSAARVMKAVRRIAATGRTVLCTIHQPSEQLFLMFDRLLLLKSGGRDVFFADCGHKGNNLVNYFEAASGYKEKLPRGGKEILPNGKVKVTLKINPANWMLDVIGAAGNKGDQQADYGAIWRESDLFKQAQQDTHDAATPKPNTKPIVLNELYLSGWMRFLTVQHRLFVSHWRNPPLNLTRAILLSFLGLIFGIIYLQISADDFGGVNSLLSVIFLGLSFPSNVIANSPLPSLFRTRAVYYRETAIGLYGYKIFSTTIFFTELPYVLVSILIFLIPFYFLVGLVNSFEHFAKFYVMALMMSLTYSSLSQLWLALLPNQIIFNVVNGIFMGMFFMFGGIAIKPSSIPQGWKWSADEQRSWHRRTACSHSRGDTDTDFSLSCLLCACVGFIM
jgi:ABC-type multidrug transport system ATPase subunit